MGGYWTTDFYIFYCCTLYFFPFYFWTSRMRLGWKFFAIESRKRLIYLQLCHVFPYPPNASCWLFLRCRISKSSHFFKVQGRSPIYGLLTRSVVTVHRCCPGVESGLWVQFVLSQLLSIGRLHDGVIWLPRPGSFSSLLGNRKRLNREKKSLRARSHACTAGKKKR